jgi:hypothetical protein
MAVGPSWVSTAPAMTSIGPVCLGKHSHACFSGGSGHLFHIGRVDGGIVHINEVDKGKEHI